MSNQSLIDSELKQLIHELVRQENVNTKLEEIIKSYLDQLSSPLNDLDEKEIFDRIKQDNSISELAAQLQQTILSGYNKANTTVVSNKRGNGNFCDLEIELLGGYSFENLKNQHEPLLDDKSNILVSISFLKQRYESKPVHYCCEPEIREIFNFSFQKHFEGDCANVNPSKLLSIDHPIHLVIMKVDSFGERTLISTQNLEWRNCLSSSSSHKTFNMELFGLGCESNVRFGILKVKLSLDCSSSNFLDSDILKVQLKLEQSRQSDNYRSFLTYAKQWWSEYTSIRTDNDKRYVKIFAQDERGQSKFVCNFIQPIVASRLLETPKECSWFVSLFCEDVCSSLNNISSNSQEIWLDLHSLLSAHKVNYASQAILLCSLFIGFSQNAYVCMGTKVDGSHHAWVVTINSDDTVHFFEPSNATMFKHFEDTHHMQSQHLYSTASCLFNNKEFYANCQPSNSVSVCSFNINNSSKWKSMSKEVISSVTHHSSYLSIPTLLPSSIDSIPLSDDLENELKQCFILDRQNENLPVVFDEKLTHLLGSHLACCEARGKSGLKCNFDFNESIYNYVPHGFTFKGYPMKCQSVNARALYKNALRSPECKDIIYCQGSDVRFAVRATVYTYAENLTSVWLMFAVIYKAIY